ncbi:MAG: hypothetical protein HZA46_07685 [Planctomycetales bacterium]|nr:hypothetical protein [Planctomycetales bacterium]
MQTFIQIPTSKRSAGRHVRNALNGSLEQLPKWDFVRAWCSVAYLCPGLHPDGFDDPDSGWPRELKRLASEAWRRADAGELADEELYPCDAQWCGLFDRMFLHLPDETQRRVELAAAFGECGDG